VPGAILGTAGVDPTSAKYVAVGAGDNLHRGHPAEEDRRRPDHLSETYTKDLADKANA